MLCDLSSFVPNFPCSFSPSHHTITADVAPLEAALQLCYSVSECGPQIVTEHLLSGQFPALVNALHSTDIALHSHPYVTMGYFDVCVRYLAMATPQSLQMLASAMTGACGLRHSDLQVRCRAAYNLLRVTEGLDPKSFMLLSHVSAFAGKYPFLSCLFLHFFFIPPEIAIGIPLALLSP